MGLTRTHRAKPPTLQEAVRWIGRLGGHLGRKAARPPGTECLWRGLTRLQTMAVGWRLPRRPGRSRDGP